MRALAPAFCALLALATACSPSPSEPAAQDERIDLERAPIIGGTVDPGDPAVGYLRARSGNVGWGCSGTLIAPNVFASAGHCVEDATSQTKLDVYLGTNVTDASPADWRSVRAFHAHPSYGTVNLSDGYDCSVLILDKAVAGVAPKPYSRTAVDASFHGKPVRIVGYGVTNGPAQTGSGTKRQLSTTITGHYGGVITTGSPGRTTCQGDSGGPTFALLGGIETMIGITSFGALGCPGEGAMSRADLCASFFDQFASASPPPPPPPPPPPSPPPPPPPGACAGAWETEPNESRASANVLCADGTIRGTIASGSDADWYTFDVAPNQTYTVQMTDLGPRFNLAVYKVTGPGEPSFISIGELTGATRSVARTTTTGGTYFVWVYGLDGAGSPGTPYTLSARTN